MTLGTVSHAAAMDSCKSNSDSKAPFWSAELRGKEIAFTFGIAAFITISYFAAVSASPSGFSYGSLLPLQIRTFFGMNNSTEQANPMKNSTEANPKQHQSNLEELFEKAAMPGKTVIITTLNAAWAENNTMIDIFLESFEHGEGTKRLLQHLIIVCLDKKAYLRCLAIHPHCLKIKTGGVDFSGEQALLSQDYIKMIWRRINFLEMVLEMNYSFIFTDADVLWLRDPFPQLLHDKKADVQIACDRYNGRPSDVRNNPNAGFMYVRANQRTVRFYKYWYKERNRDPKMADQEVLNAIKSEDMFQSIGLNLRFLDTQFFGGFCGIRFTDMTKALTMHATCCKGLANKLTDLRRILDGWKEWQQHVSEPVPTSAINVRSHRRAARRGRISTGRSQRTLWDMDPHFKPIRACPKSMRAH